MGETMTEIELLRENETILANRCREYEVEIKRLREIIEKSRASQYFMEAAEEIVRLRAALEFEYGEGWEAHLKGLGRL